MNDKQYEMYHTTRDGKKIPLNELKTDHLKNIIALQERLSVKGVLYRTGGGTCPDDYWYDEEELHGEDALKFMNHDLYVDELRKR